MVASCPILSEALVRRDQQATIADRESPQVRVRQALINGPANILDIMAEFAQVIHRHARNVLIDQDLHPSVRGGRDRGDLFFRQFGCVVEASHDICPLERWILGEQIVDGVAVGEHADDLMDRDAGALDAGLSVTDGRVDGDSFEGHDGGLHC